MREIKFRAWDNRDNKIKFPLMIDFIDGAVFGINIADELVPHFPNDVILQQFTGIKDKNGKDIYEGDIIAHNDESVYHFLDRENYQPQKGIWIEKIEGINITPSFKEKVIYGKRCEVVEWQDKLTGFYPFADSPENCGHCGGGYSPENFKVVGNIYENPELLN